VNLAQLLVVVVLAAMIAGLLSRRVSPTVAVISALLSLYLLNVIDASSAFAGFSNPAPVTIAALYVVAAGIDRTAALVPTIGRVLGRGSLRAANRRSVLASAGLSAFMANTPVVAMLLSPVRTWARNRRIPESKLLMPISYATIIGGNLTLVGTSTTLIASGLLLESGYEPLSFWEPARLGLPFAVLALAVLVATAPLLTPHRGADDGNRADPIRPYVVALTVDGGGPLDGVTVADGGLRALPSMYLVGVEHDGDTTAPVSPQTVLRGGDVLNFAGRRDDVVDIDHRQGLTLKEAEHLWALDDRHHAWYEAVIGPSSPLVGRTIKDAGFRQRYQAAAVAVTRDGDDVNAKLGDVRLQVGDSLLLVSDLGFGERWHNQADFLVIDQRQEPPPTARSKARLALAIMATVVALPMLGVTDVLRAAVAGAVATVLTGVLTPRQARDAVNINVVIMIGAAIGIGSAVDGTGLADRVANGLIDTLAFLGPIGTAAAVVASTMVLTELISNAGAIAVMMPLALSTAAQTDGDPRRFALAVTLTASASFLTPIGYQTNTMVFGPGRYEATDYLRLGLPLASVTMIMATLFIATDLGTVGW
jgi:di/tricarboxylate transporter